MIVKYTGLGFLLGWLWLFLMHGPLLYEVSSLIGINSNTLFCSFLGFHAVSFLIVFLAKNLMTSFQTRLVFSSLGSLLMTGITLLICLNLGVIFPVDHFILYGALFFCALGSSLLLVLWGEYFATLSGKEAALYYTGSILTGTALFFCINLLQYETAVFATASLPLISMIFLSLLLLSQNNHSKQQLEPQIDPLQECEPQQSTLASSDQELFPFTAKLIWIIFIFYMAGGILYRIIYLSGSYPTPDSYWLTNLIYCTVTILAGMMIAFSNKIKIPTLFRPALFLLGTGFILFPLFFKTSEFIPFTFFQSGFAFFDIFIWLLFTEIAKQKNPIRVFSIGYFFVTFSIFLGEISFANLISFFLEGKDQLSIISLSAALIMFIAALVFDEKFTSISLLNVTTNKEAHFNEIEEPIITLESKHIPNKKKPQLLIPINEEQEESTGEFLLTDFFAPYNLTPRETEIATLLLQGRNNPYIREDLNISPNTLKTHLRNILRKFSINNRQDLLSLFDKAQSQSSRNLAH